ncbi:armadillo-type protein [Xylariales sp. PMI_506]|nr:armadillo-type protein [Xylariales sp. PMI_506]
MTSSLQALFEVAYSDPDGTTCDFVGNLCYSTKGEADRRGGLKTLLAQLYQSITSENYQDAVRWTDVLAQWITLEHNVPRRVRAVLVRIYYNLTLTPGMDGASATAFGDMVCRLVNDKQGERCLEQGKDLTLDWRPLFERLKCEYLLTENILANSICFEQFAGVVRDFFDPTERVAVLEEVLPYFATTDSHFGVGAIRVVVLVSPTAPAPESRWDCQPTSLMPTYWHLFAKLFRTQAATVASIELFSLIAKNHLECGHISFGAHGVFDEMLSGEILAAISRLTLVDDKNTDDSFDGPPLHSSYRDEAAEAAAVWIVFSLSPLCLRQESAMLSGLESLIASIGILYHPNSTVQSRLGFVTKLLQQLAYNFCWRYNKEQSGQLVTPPDRRINDELRQRFVRLLRDPVLLGCFSTHIEVREDCTFAAKSLANLEPGLVVPTALQRFYASQGSQIDGQSAELILECVFNFATEAFDNDFDTDENDRRAEAQRHILAVAEVCFMSISPQMLEEAIVILSRRLSSDPIPKARDLMSSLVEHAVRVNPKKGLQVFVPMLVKHIRKEIEERWSETRPDRYDLMSTEENLCWYASALGSCLRRGGSELLSYKDEVLRLVQFAEQRCGSRAFGLCGMLSTYMLSGWTETYTNRSTVASTGQLGCDQYKIDMKVITWHTPSSGEIQAASEVFESKATQLDQEICALIDRHHSLSGAGASVNWARSLTGALGYMDNLVCGMATLFHPGHTRADNDSKNVSDDTVCVELRVQDFHCVLEPCNPLYTKIHQRRGAIGALANKVHVFLVGCKGQYGDCLEGVYDLYKSLISDVGFCHMSQNLGETYRFWASGFKIEGVPPLYPPAIEIGLTESYHTELQKFGTGYRHIGHLEKRILEDMTEGCSSPYLAVRNAAQSLLQRSTEQLAGSVGYFFPLMLKKLRSLIESNNYLEIEGALETLIWGNSWWTRHCLSQTPDLLRVLMGTASFDVPKVPQIAKLAREGIERMGIPDYGGRIVFPEDGIVEAIRPASDYSDKAQELKEFQHKDKAAVREEMNAIGIQVLQSTIEPKLCALSVRALIRFGFEKDAPPPIEHVSFLADNAVTGDSELRKWCVEQLSRMIGDFLAGICFSHNLEDFIRTQGTGGCEQVLMFPGRDTIYTDQYLDKFKDFGEGDDNDDTFVDPSFYGSLVWPFQFHAQRRDVEWPHDPEMVLMAERIGSFVTRHWFEKFLSHLQREEQPWEEDADASEPGIRTGNVDLLTYVFRLMELGATAAKLEEMEQMIRDVFGDGTKVGQHIATATLLLGLIQAPTSRAFRLRVSKMVDPLLIDILEHKMIHSKETWVAFLHWLTRNRDPRRFPRLLHYVGSLRLDASDSGTESKTKIHMLSILITDIGWRFRYGKDVVSMLLQARDLISSVDISDNLGRTLAQVYTSRLHDSWPDVRTLIASNNEVPSLGIRPYKFHSDMQDTVAKLFETISVLRKKNPIPHQDYYKASKAALAFVSAISKSNASETLIPLLRTIIEELFSMLEAQLTEKTDLKELATSVLEMLCRLPFREDESSAFLKAVLEKAKSGPFFHRTTAMGMIQVLYLQRLSISEPAEQTTVLKAVNAEIEDTDIKIQNNAAETLRNLFSRSRLRVTKPVIADLIQNCEHTLRGSKNNIVRWAAVRRLSAAILAYPHLMIPPIWMVQAMKSIVQEAFNSTGLLREIAIETIRSFKEVRRTQWDMVKKNLSNQIVKDIDDVVGPTYYA